MTIALQSYDIKHDSASQNINELGMRVMQARVWDKRNSKNLLIKSPPASGKSRALMYVALDKLANQNIKKVIAAVPERSIGASFKSTDLKSSGFFADWNVESKNNLISNESERDEKSKVKAFIRFIESDEGGVLLCTHSTLREAFKTLPSENFEDCLVAVDEFHHLSIAEDNRLGNVVKELLNNQRTHVLGMTGSYFRGDSNYVLLPEHESMFTEVTFTYYEQLIGYNHLKKINIGHHFYSVVKENDDAAPYIAGIREVYKPGKKTIIHIPQTNSKESVDWVAEFDGITDIFGEFMLTDPKTGVFHYECKKTGHKTRVARLVGQDESVENFLRELEAGEILDEVDVIIAMKRGIEGFDWPAAEIAITVGARSSLTQIVQIIGRVTRDYPGKKEASFINLIREPLIDQITVEDAVNDMLKAISASLLMEQVISPEMKFGPQNSSGDNSKGDGLTDVVIIGCIEPSDKVRAIMAEKGKDLISHILNEVKDGGHNKRVLEGYESGAQYFNEVLIPNVIETKLGSDEYANLDDDDRESMRQQLMLNISYPKVPKKPDPKPKDTDGSSTSMIQMAKKLNVEKLSLDMIEKINPFMEAYEMIGRPITPELLLKLRNHIKAHRSNMSATEAFALFPAIEKFVSKNDRLPSFDSGSDIESQLAEAVQIINAERAKHIKNNEE
jgi:hypothetical protein